MKIPITISLAFIAGILSVGVLASALGSKKSEAETARDRFDLVNHGLRTAWRVVVGIVGITVLAIGLALLVLPGPGMLVIPVGLMILASEFVWARRWLQRIRGNGRTPAPIPIRKAS